MPSEKPVNDQMQALVDCLTNTNEEEADCLEFDRQMDCLAERLAAGVAAEDAITPEIKAHLANSRDCREEFEALLTVLKAEQAGEFAED